jgi:hypothetical protein
MKKNDIVKYHTPYEDEDPNARYLLLDDPAERIAHQAELAKNWPNEAKIKPRVDIQYLGDVNAEGALVPTTMMFRPIHTILIEDLVVAAEFKASGEDDAKFAGKTVLIKAPADKGGTYIGADGKFGASRKKAKRHDYDCDEVGKQVAQAKFMGMPIEIELA